MKTNTTTLWVCIDCMLTQANGECNPDPDREPLSLIDDGDEITLGMMFEEHADGCTIADRAPDYECDCERREFSQSSCDGCGSHLHGERHAMTLWFD